MMKVSLHLNDDVEIRKNSSGDHYWITCDFADSGTTLVIHATSEEQADYLLEALNEEVPSYA